MSRLLVMSCSMRKPNQRTGPASELYDGSAFRVLRKGAPRGVQYLILSAEYGLIRSTHILAPYDRKMDEERAAEFQAEKRVERARKLLRAMDGWPFAEVFCHCGSLYRLVLQHYEAEGVFGDARVRFTEGRIGEQLAQLKQFLREGRPQVRRGNFWRDR